MLDSFFFSHALFQHADRIASMEDRIFAIQPIDNVLRIPVVTFPQITGVSARVRGLQLNPIDVFQVRQLWAAN